MATISDESAAAAFLAMTRKITNDDIKKRFADTPVRKDLVTVPNESPDASLFLNENRKPNPETRQILDALKASHAMHVLRSKSADV